MGGDPKGVGYLPPEKGTAEKDSYTNFSLPYSPRFLSQSLRVEHQITQDHEDFEQLPIFEFRAFSFKLWFL